MPPVRLATGIGGACRAGMVPTATTGPQGTRRRLMATARHVGASRRAVAMGRAPMLSISSRPSDDPFMGTFVIVPGRATTAGPLACSNGLGPATSVAVLAFAGRPCITLPGTSSITRGRPVGRVVGPNRPLGVAFRMLGRPSFGVSAGPTLPSTTATCRRAGPRRVAPL